MSRIATATALALVVVLAGCSDEPPAGPKAADLKAQRDALVAKMKNKKKSAPAPVVQSPDAAAQGEEGADFGSVASDYVYDATGKRDPFRSFRWDRQVDVAEDTVLGPLEQFELEQLSVTAVIWDTRKARALISDPSSRSYVIEEGTKIGKNDGLVIHIGDNLVLVKETYVDFAGDTTTKDVELRIRTSQGG